MSEVFDYLCPTYMAYGMTWEQYWYGDPWMVRAFQDTYLLKRRIKNEELWLQGLYIYRAVHAVVASAVGGRSEKYISTPLDFLPKTKAEREQEEFEKKQKVIRYLDSLAKMGIKKSNEGVDKDGKP